MTTYQLLFGGYRKTFTKVTFDPATAKLKTVSNSPAPESASWLEKPGDKVKDATSNQVFYGLSETEQGVAYGLEAEGAGFKVTQKRETHGGPAHIHCMKDGSGIVVANYVGGSAIFFPTDQSTHALVADSESPLLEFPYVYKDSTPPNPERQDASHVHQVIEGEGGVLYMPDLGSDRVWVVKREGTSGLKIHGYLQAPPGAGPRHAVLSLDGANDPLPFERRELTAGKHLYCLTELHSTILAWTLPYDASSAHPLPDFEASIIPPSVPKSHSAKMDSAELCIHPNYPRTLFASNRLELQIFDKQPDLPKLPDYPPTGDAIAIFTLSDDGTKVVGTKHVRTGCDNVRGMLVSPDGKFVALAGQDGGGVEIWSVGGEKGDEWKLAAKEEGIEGVTTIVWI